jgi:hypothetical protein
MDNALGHVGQERGGQVGKAMDNAVSHVAQERKTNIEPVPIHVQAMEEVRALGNLPHLHPAS